ncbi:MAG: 2,3-bisphosphoglycerate-independent phosphoglycerate mutase [Wenzhouxiangella sp.]
MSQAAPLLLLILDGWGHREPAPDNAISQGRTPNWDALVERCPQTLLDTSGEAVGLPAGQMGNSEVGHMNIGAGRVVYQELTRIGKAIRDGDFARNAAVADLLARLKDSGGRLHLMGLLSPGGVHSHEDHLFAILDLLDHDEAPEVVVHAFLDGRDMPPRSALPSLERLDERLGKMPRARLGSVCGRYYAMDRDQRWERVEQAWQVMVDGQADHQAGSGTEALAAAYGRDENDEFVSATRIGDGVPMADGDGVFFFNFRADRARQLTQALVSADFDGFQARRPSLAAVLTMTHYQDGLDCLVAFPPERMERLMGEVLADAGKRQLRIAETEKYAHVTYFFNGGEERVFDGEDRELIPSPKVATYDLQPEMSAPLLAEKLTAAIRSGKYPVIISNVANPDMVGHSGQFEAAVKAVEAVDGLLGDVLEAIEAVGGEMLVTADHGNVEQMTDPDTGQAHTAHTLNPVPLLYVGPRRLSLGGPGSLRDIAPTMLDLLGLEKPSEMSGNSLINNG